jgi:hypothetical protein
MTGQERPAKSAKEGSALTRWLGYAVIFIVTAFVLHTILVIVTLVTGIARPESLLTMGGPVTFVVEFGLAAFITWLIVRPRPEPAVNVEGQRKGDAYLAEQRRYVEAVEQEHLEAERLERLTAALDRWRQARDLRASVSEALADLGDGDATTPEGASLRDELTWALDYADRMDPLRG